MQYGRCPEKSLPQESTTFAGTPGPRLLLRYRCGGLPSKIPELFTPPRDAVRTFRASIDHTHRVLGQPPTPHLHTLQPIRSPNGDAIMEHGRGGGDDISCGFEGCTVKMCAHRRVVATSATKEVNECGGTSNRDGIRMLASSTYTCVIYTIET